MAKSHARRRQPESSAKTTAPKCHKRALITAEQKAVRAGRVLITDLPVSLPVDKRELALCRAFLAEEIEAILRNGD